MAWKRACQPIRSEGKHARFKQIWPAGLYTVMPTDAELKVFGVAASEEAPTTAQDTPKAEA